METLRLWRARELTGSAGLGLWAAFHLWEQWSAFGGRARFVERMSSSSHGALALVVELALGLAPLVAFLVLDVVTARRGDEPDDLARALAEDEALALRLGRLGRWGSRALLAFLLYHVVWLFLPKLTDGSDPLATWVRLRDGMGLWPHAIAHAIGLTAFAVHLFQAPPRLAIVLGLAHSAEMRRGLRLSSLILSVGALMLYAQLAGWHAAGAGTIWPLTPR